MKPNRFFLLGLLSILVCSSCSRDEEDNHKSTDKEPLSRVSAVSFTSQENDSVLMSRSTDTGTFVANDAIGVFCEDQNGTTIASNVKYIYDGSQFNAADKNSTIYVGSNSIYKYYVYFPYIASATLTSVPFTLPVNQSSGKSQADLLGAINTTSVAGAATIALSFQHKLSLLNVDYSTVGKTLSSATIQSNINGGTYNPKTGGFSTTSGSTVLTPYRNNSTMFSCILPAQDFAKGFILGQIDYTDGTKRTLSLDNALSLQAGKQCTLKLSTASYIYSSWTTNSLSVTAPGTISCCGGQTTVSVTANQSRTKTLLIDGEAKETTTEYQSPTVTSSANYVTNQNGWSAGEGSITAPENRTTSATSCALTVSYGGVKEYVTVRQAANNISTASSTTALSSIHITSASVNACGVLTASSTRTLTTKKEATTTQCGTVVTAASTFDSTENITPSYSTISENTSTSSRSVSVTASYTYNGVTKYASKTITQPGAIISGGQTNTTVNAAVSVSSLNFVYTAGFKTATATLPKTQTSARVTACGTTITNASTYTGYVSSVSGDKDWISASVSGTTITISVIKNTSAARSGSVSVYFSNGTSKTINISQDAAQYDVDVNG